MQAGSVGHTRELPPRQKRPYLISMKRTRTVTIQRLSSCIFTIAVFLFPTVKAISGTPPKQPFRVLGPSSTASVPLLLLAEEDPIEGIDIKTELFINHPQALARLLKGDADLLFTGTSSGWENYLDGGPLVVVNTGVWGVSSLVGKDPSIKGFSDLKGKRVALPFPGSPLDFQTRAILRRKGIDPDKDLTLSYSPFPQTVPMLLLGEVDAAPLPEPLATDVVMNRGLRRLIDYRKAWAEVNGGDERSPQVSLFCVRRDVVSKGALFAQVVGEWRRVSELVNRGPEGAAARTARALSLPAPVVSAAITNTLYFVPSFQENKSMVWRYYEEVKEYLPAKRGALKADFFFLLDEDCGCGK